MALVQPARHAAYHQLDRPSQPGQLQRAAVRERISLAAQLLETRPGLALEAVADLAGLGSPESLRRHFRSHGLASPARYRKHRQLTQQSMP
jgi:transcriptional regulator GlxA family with amidase domain